MTFRISIEAPAAAEMDSAYRWIAERSPLNAVRWYHGLIESLHSLEQFPTRCGLAPESRHFKEQIRQLGYGTRMRRYRALFVIRGRTVHILHFRHWARASMRQSTIRFPQ